MDAGDFTPKGLDELVLRWRAMSARRGSAAPARCNCGCKCPNDAATTRQAGRTRKSAGLAMAAEPSPACR